MTVILAVAGPLCLMTLAVDSSSIRLTASETLTGIGAHATDDLTCQPSVSSRVTIAATVASTESSWVGEEMNGRLRLRSTKSRRWRSSRAALDVFSIDLEAVMTSSSAVLRRKEPASMVMTVRSLATTSWSSAASC